jgi:catechol 2,3-dioxygenase-like lactoylglutathione lyase family enzyme
MSASTDMSGVRRFVTLRRCVASLQRSIAFYGDALGFELADTRSGAAAQAVLSLGCERIVLNERTRGGVGADWPPPASGPNGRFQHIAIVTCDMDAAFRRLQGHAFIAITRGGPQRLPAASGGVRAFKFRDPDAHPLELIEFPQGKGAARWRSAARDRGPTLGIDHAAISVADVDRSIAFYQALGFMLAARQVNRGEEQARLDGLAHAVVDVAALLTPTSGSPHLELLGYSRPAPTRGQVDGRDTSDLLVWQVQPSDGAGSQPFGDEAPPITDPDGHLHRFQSSAGASTLRAHKLP